MSVSVRARASVCVSGCVSVRVHTSYVHAHIIYIQTEAERKTEAKKGTATEREANREIERHTLASMSKRFRVCARRKMHMTTHNTPTSHLIVAKNYIKINRCVCVFVRARV